MSHVVATSSNDISSPNDYFECNSCGVEYTCTGNKSLNCAECTVAFSLKSRGFKNLNVSAGSTTTTSDAKVVAKLKCAYCPSTFANKIGRAHHTRQMHGDKLPEKSPGSMSKSKSNLSKSNSQKSAGHSQNPLTKKTAVSCKYCSWTFVSTEARASHVRKVHSDLDLPVWESRKPMKCKVCPMKFVGKQSLAEHVKSAHPDLKIVAVKTKSVGQIKKRIEENKVNKNVRLG